MDAQHSTPRVALLALLLREAAKNHHTNEQGHLDDLVCYPGELSLATLAAGSLFGPGEWEAVHLLSWDPPGWTVVQTAGDLCEEGATLLAEALLHAHGPKGKRTRASWAEPYMDRWWRVRAAIRGYEAQGIAARFGDTDRDAERAYCAVTGSTPEEMDDRWPPEDDPRDQPLPDPSLA